MLDQEPLWIRSIDVAGITPAYDLKLSIVRKLNHGSLLRCYAILVHQGVQYVVLEQPGHRTMADYLQSAEWIVSRNQSRIAADILTQIARVYQYLDGKGYTLSPTDLSQIRIKDQTQSVAIQISGYGVCSSGDNVTDRDDTVRIWSALVSELVSCLADRDDLWTSIWEQANAGQLHWRNWLTHPVACSTQTAPKSMAMPVAPSTQDRVNSASPLGWSNLSRSKPETISPECPRDEEFDFYVITPTSSRQIYYIPGAVATIGTVVPTAISPRSRQ